MGSHSGAKLISRMMLLVVLLLPAGAAANEDGSVLGIPWGASPVQVRQIMAEKQFAFKNELIHPEDGHFRQIYEGSYASYPATFSVRFLEGRMYALSPVVWYDDANRQSAVFNDLAQLLAAKYGPRAADESRVLPVHCPPRPAFSVPITVHLWKVSGDTQRIRLTKQPAFRCGNQKMDGNVSVEYLNVQLLESLKSKSRQNI